MKVKDILKLLPKALLSEMCKKYNVNHKSTKLSAERLFSLMLYTMFSERFCSLRKLQQNYEDPKVQREFLGIHEPTTIDHSTFHYRLTKIDADLFKEIYERTAKKYRHTIANTKSRYELKRFDSTIVSLSSKLLKKVGFRTNQSWGKNKHIKYTVGYSQIPEVVQMHSTKSYVSENKALGEAIRSREPVPNSILLFDRGISDRKILDEISQRSYFISRLKKNDRIAIIKERNLKKETESLELIKELEGHLYKTGGAKSKEVYRIIKARKKKVVWDKKKETLVRGKMKRKIYKGKSKEELKREQLQEELIFITNIPKQEMSVEEVVNTYKKRWEIEVFFKFLKQELDFSHFVNRTENGIKVVMYIRMIYALLLLVYKSKNKLEGYKYVKSAMMSELEGEFIRYVIDKSGGSYKKWRTSKKTFW